MINFEDIFSQDTSGSEDQPSEQEMFDPLARSLYAMRTAMLEQGLPEPLVDSIVRDFTVGALIKGLSITGE